MKIAIDARPLQNESGLRGVGRYVRELIGALRSQGAAGAVQQGAPGAVQQGAPGAVQEGAELVVLESRWGRRAAPAPDRPGRTIRLARPSRAITLFDQIATPLLCARERFDVFHSTFYALSRLRPGRTRTVITIHDLIPLLGPGLASRKNTAIFSEIYRSARGADAVIVPSARTARDLRERIGVDPGKIRVIPMGVGAPFVSTRSAVPGGPVAREDRSGAPVLVYVGGFDPSKNVPLLFEMLARLSDRRVRLAIAGDPGASRAALVEASLRAGIGERIEWLGRLGEEELAAVYRRADLFVTASRHEGFGLPALEAMASGCPVVALRSGPVPEVLESAGVGVEGEDPDDFARAVERVLGDPALRDDLIARGAARAGELSWAATARATLALYREVTSVSSGAVSSRASRSPEERPRRDGYASSAHASRSVRRASGSASAGAEEPLRESEMTGGPESAQGGWAGVEA